MEYDKTINDFENLNNNYRNYESSYNDGSVGAGVGGATSGSTNEKEYYYRDPVTGQIKKTKNPYNINKDKSHIHTNDPYTNLRREYIYTQTNSHTINKKRAKEKAKQDSLVISYRSLLYIVTFGMFTLILLNLVNTYHNKVKKQKIRKCYKTDQDPVVEELKKRGYDDTILRQVNKRNTWQ